jgi:DNA polymerase III delta subunit
MGYTPFSAFYLSLMLTNLYLFTGENQYELRQELARRKDNFSQKFGAESIFTYHSENRNAGEIKQNLYGGGLFVTKKLIILEGVPLDNEQTNKLKEEQYGKLTEDIIATPNIPNDTLLICVSYAPDKRGRFYKFLTKEGQIKEFKLLDKNGLRLFVKQQAEGIKMDDGAIKALIEKV